MQEITRGASIVQESLPHTVNVAVHVVCASLALIIGGIQLVAGKGNGSHRFRGHLFVTTMTLVITTAVIGLSLFRFGAFLAVITAMAAYWTYSGWRALQISRTGLTIEDAVVSCIGLVVVGAFLVYLPAVRLPWAASVIYSTLASLTLVCSYDLARFTFPTRWFSTLGVYEHAVKMIGAHGAIVSAFAGTVLGAWQPYSQLVPSAVWTIAMLAFPVHHYFSGRRKVAQPFA